MPLVLCNVPSLPLCTQLRRLRDGQPKPHRQLRGLSEQLPSNMPSPPHVRSCGTYAMGNPNPIDNCVASQNNCPGTVGTLPKCSGRVYTMGGGPGTIMSELGRKIPRQHKKNAREIAVPRPVPPPLLPPPAAPPGGSGATPPAMPESFIAFNYMLCALQRRSRRPARASRPCGARVAPSPDPSPRLKVVFEATNSEFDAPGALRRTPGPMSQLP